MKAKKNSDSFEIILVLQIYKIMTFQTIFQSSEL